MSAFDPCCRTTMNKGENSRCVEGKKKEKKKKEGSEDKTHEWQAVFFNVDRYRNTVML